MVNNASSNFDWLIVGLGNPGPQYRDTWHNLGFMALARMAGRFGFCIDKIRFKGLCADVRLSGRRLLLLAPQTYMNDSGIAVREASHFYHIPPERILVIYDDFELPLGVLRIREHGSAGTHNGMKSIIQQLGTDRFPRLRIAYGPRPLEQDTASFVLSKIPDKDRPLVAQTLDRAVDAVLRILEKGVPVAMSQINGQAPAASPRRGKETP